MARGADRSGGEETRRHQRADGRPQSPGVTIRPSLALYGKTFSAQFYDNVRVPAKNMVGEVNNGWKVITDALAAERVMIGGTRMAVIERAFDHLTEYVKTASRATRRCGPIR